MTRALTHLERAERLIFSLPRPYDHANARKIAAAIAEIIRQVELLKPRENEQG